MRYQSLIGLVELSNDGGIVEVVFDHISPECALPVFQPVDETIHIQAFDQEDVKKTTSDPETGLHPEDYKTIRYEISGKNDAICIITLNREEKYNAINKLMATELIDAFQSLFGQYFKVNGLKSQTIGDGDRRFNPDTFNFSAKSDS